MIGQEDTINILVKIAKDMKDNEISVFSSWLYDKIKNRAEILRIEQFNVNIEENEIESILNDVFQNQTGNYVEK